MLIHGSTCCFTVLLAVSRFYLLSCNLYLLVLQFYLLHTIQQYIMSTSQAGSSSPFRAGSTYPESGRLSIDTIDDAGSTRGFQGDSIDTIGEAGSRQGFLGDGPVPSQPSRALSNHSDRINLHFGKLAANRLSTDTFGEAGSRQGFLENGPVPSLHVPGSRMLVKGCPRQRKGVHAQPLNHVLTVPQPSILF